MTVDGSIDTGGCTCAILIATGWNPVPAMIIAILAGSFAGLLTGLLTTKLKIPGILAGILMMLALYSINLHIMSDWNFWGMQFWSLSPATSCTRSTLRFRRES